MAKLTIRITHVAWRDGRPRFTPGPQLREEGWKGEDLRHGPALRGRMTGPWYTAEEALIWAEAREKAIEARRAELAAAKAQRKRRPAFAAPAAARIGLSIDELFERYWKSPRMAGEDVVDGKRRQKAASPNTVKDYKAKAAALAKFDAEFCCLPVDDALSSIIVYDLYERLWTAKGLAMARGTVAVLSAAIGWGIKRGLVKLGSNPCLGLKLETPAPRVRCLTPVEVLRLVAAADALGRPEIGDAIVLGVWTGQRQIDRLAIADGGVLDGRRVFRQTKTKAVVMIPDAPELRARLAAARERRSSWRVVPVELIVDERQRKPWGASHYAHEFARIRAAAVAGIKDAATGAVLVEPLPSLADARDQDLRDTAVTWLARAGCTMPEIAQITGHSLQSIQQTLKHYLASHPEIADHAIAKLVAWYDGQMAGV